MVAPLRITRTPLLHTAAIRVERVHYAGLSRERTAETHEPETQILLTLGGSFVYHVGRTRRLVDANRIAFVHAGQTSADSHVTGGDVCCLVLTPDPALIGDRRLAHTAPASIELQLAAARWAALLGGGAVEPVLAEEPAIRLACAALAGPGAADAVSPSAAARLTERAKALLAPGGPPVGLASLARQLAVCPAYLSDAFRRTEGVPLVRYQLRLRLVRALAELPHTDDLTALALELGFSSHSHFTTAFRTTLGLTPSQYRRQVRPAIQKT
ncbi:MAG TPA: helix-turn-helix transcriptional regulator [Kofleriaceae bacterium]|jgi:AraC-like DNA-binding protein|nr:helix-turn-helix transcriptional regulator [Kofleriaceae bacterium]